MFVLDFPENWLGYLFNISLQNFLVGTATPGVISNSSHYFFLVWGQFLSSTPCMFFLPLLHLGEIMLVWHKLQIQEGMLEYLP